MGIKEDIAFNEIKQKFENSYSKIIEAISEYEKSDASSREQLGISEIDYIRLTRVSQLAKRMAPKRDVISIQGNENTQRSAYFEMLTNFVQNITKGFQQTRKIKDQEKNKTFANSYILSEECIANLHELQICDRLLRSINHENAQDIEQLLDVPLDGQVIDEQRDGPGILDDYRQGNWGVERICLDGIQNHLPKDSKGTDCFLSFLIDDKWVDIGIAKLSPEKITKVRFADNGVGFTTDNLIFLHSTKSSEEKSVGQFGEGMKLASMASVNLGLGMELQSRNWSAFAIGENKKLINTRQNDEVEEHKRLVYDIKVYDGAPLVGSRTIFHTPTREFIDFALQLPDKVLELKPKYKPAFTTEYGDIVDYRKGGQAFVKGVYVKNINSLFSYNFDNANVNPDRNDITNFNLDASIIGILKELNNKGIMKQLIAKVIDWNRENPNVQYSSEKPIEVIMGEYLYSDFKNGKGMPSLWKEAFKEVCEQKGALNEDGTSIESVLKTDYKVPEQLNNTLSKYNVVALPKYWTLALQMAGIKTDRESLPEYMNETISTSLSLDYGKEIWDNEQIVLDATQNHLPMDSGGSNVFLRFQTSDGLWHDFREFSEFDDGDIKKIKISDNGKGYDAKNLGLFASVKEHDKSTGKWGEGLKMLSAAAIRKGVKMELRSRDWLATPTTQSVVLNQGKENEKQIEQLVFDVITKVNSGSKILDDGDNPERGDYGYSKKYESSSTTFIDPDPELIKEFRNIRDNVLAFERRDPIVNLGNAEVLDLSNGNLFVRNIRIPGNHNIKYSYHLKSFDIQTRDRNIIETQSMQEQLRGVLQSVNSERFISSFLRDAVEYAKEHGDKSYLEFETPFEIPSESNQADMWIKVFKQDFGKKTSIRDSIDQNMNSVHQAAHIGVDMVTLPSYVARALFGIKGRDGQTITSYEQELNNALNNTIDIPESDLTEREKQMIEHLHKYNDIISSENDGEEINQIRVYDYDSKYDGVRASGFASKGDVINISRDALNGDLLELGHVFFHEMGHAITGAEDAAKAFRDYFTHVLSKIAIKEIPLLEQSVNDNSIADNIRLSQVQKEEEKVYDKEVPEIQKVGERDE